MNLKSIFLLSITLFYFNSPFANATLKDEFCENPFNTICGNTNKKYDYENSKNKADKLFLEDLKKAFLVVAKENGQTFTLNENQLFRLSTKINHKSIDTTAKYVEEIQYKLTEFAWKRVDSSAPKFAAQIISKVREDIFNEPYLTLFEKNNMSKQLSEIFIPSTSQTFRSDYLKYGFQSFCGSMDQQYTDYSINANVKTVMGQSYMTLCPGPIYLALSIYKNDNPMAALEKYYSVIIAHEIGHILDSRHFKGQSKLSASCSRNHPLSYNEAYRDETIGDYWGTSRLSKWITEFTQTQSPDEAVHELIQKSALTWLCGTKGSVFNGHETPEFRVNFLIKNNTIRNSLGCTEKLKREDLCFIEMKSYF